MIRQALSFRLGMTATGYDGTWDAQSASWTGTWSQNGQTLPLVFKRGMFEQPPTPKLPN
jgi:hypothetical protein